MPDKPERPDPAKHQPSAAEMREVIKLEGATLDALGAAMVRGGAEAAK